MTVGKKSRKELRRRRPLRGGASPKRRGRLAKINTARQAKRRQRYAAKLAKARKGQGYAEAMERAGGRCEWTIFEYDGRSAREVRCPETEGLHAHHLHYTRFGGDELASDYAILCQVHHEFIEQQQFPHRQRRRSA